MKTIGRHLIAEYYRCQRDLLDDVDAIRGVMLDAASVIGAQVVGESFQRFAPQGVSGTIVIAESHLSIHTWPENGYVAVDIFTCGGLDPHPGFELIGGRLEAESSRILEIVRGLDEDVEASRDLLPQDVKIMTHIATERDLAVRR